MTPVAPKLKWPWDEAQLKALAQWIGQVKDLLAGRISYRNNMASDMIAVEFVAGSTPSKRVDLLGRPLMVLLGSLEQISPASNAPPNVSQAFSWTFANGMLSFPSLGTIAGTAKYRATILVVKE